MPDVKFIAIASGKGGVGKTTVSAGLAEAFAHLGKKTLAVDADLAFRNLDLMLNVKDGGIFDLDDVIEERCRLEDTICASGFCENLWYMPATLSKTNSEKIDSVFMREFLKILKSRYDILIFDTAAGLGKSFELFALNSDVVCIVTTPHRAAMRDAERTAEVLASKDIPAYLVVNMVNPAQIQNHSAPNIDEIIDSVGLPLIGLVPADNKVPGWQNNGISVYSAQGSRLRQQLCDMAARLTGMHRTLTKFW
ncbi:MAG: AAA family ATPase [Bacillota bacterium]|nr:AAA family ATPase [Bacillota bacterium]